MIGFSLKEVLLMSIIGALTFYFLQTYDKGFAYQWTVTVVVFVGALMLEVPTTQQRFLDILKKAVQYSFMQKEYIQNTKRKEICR